MAELAGQPLVILLVEDNEAHAELFFRSMREHRVANLIYHADDGEKALDFLFHRGAYEKTKTSPRPNLILLDLRLPKIDGLDVLKIIKQTPHLKDIPVIVLTSSDAESDIVSSYGYNANGYVVKPLDFAKYSQAMQAIGGFWLGWNTIPHRDNHEEPPTIPL
jgi:CheY-like chemotaxis protein